MRPLPFVVLIVIFTSMSFRVSAQNNRISTYETIGWYNYFGTFKLNEKFGLHTEFQWRRANLITEPQQNLLRLGLNYNLKPKVLLRVGYAFIETFAYGEIPINALGRNFTEHRIYQMAQLAQQEGKLEISHRFMLEQRFVGRYSSANVEKEDQFPLLHRARYMVRIQAPLKGEKITDKTPYWAVYNEIFVGFGQNVNANVFDQNRIGLLLGYRFSPKFRLEGGYLNQIVQFGRQINGQNVFQYNNGLIINANFNFDLSKK
jgi:hypothetical protein